MRGIDRFNVLDKIGRELQSRMTYFDIGHYLSGFGIDVKDVDAGEWNSKWLYAKHLLRNAPDELLLRIADELDIAHGYSVNPALPESRYWMEGHFRFFLSHVSLVKESAARLRDALKVYAISSFVAHTDIEPTAEWCDEIEKALYSMHGLGAIVTSEFRASAWCDQEVGVAFGRGTLIVPIMKGATPHGFIGKYQGINAEGKSVQEVAESVFRVLASHPKTKLPLANALVHQFLFASDDRAALHFLKLLRRIGKPPDNVFEKLRENSRSRELLVRAPAVLKELNKLLKEHGLANVEPAVATPDSTDDVPF